MTRGFDLEFISGRGGRALLFDQLFQEKVSPLLFSSSVFEIGEEQREDKE